MTPRTRKPRPEYQSVDQLVLPALAGLMDTHSAAKERRLRKLSALLQRTRNEEAAREERRNR